jgi:nitrate/nitrite-specific signal transduction histidine kinase
MQKATFKIRRKIIVAFLFSLLSVLIFSMFSFQVHREIGHRLRLLELTDDLFQTILELRRVEKNFFLYRQVASLNEAETYLAHARNIYQSHESEILRLKKHLQQPEFVRSLDRYREILAEIRAVEPKPGTNLENQKFVPLEEALRRQVRITEYYEKWGKKSVPDRSPVSTAVILFIISVVVFLALGIVVAFYLSRMLVQPLVQMQQAMDKIAHGDFTPLPESGTSSEEFFALFRPSTA